MTRKIALLPADLANQIAAGEVVERPASIVKELVENSLDAGARRVTVDVEQGGVTLLRVADDGEGMSADDAALSVERHATSKIKALADLDAIHSYGFRGEALPSIASVSRFELRTRRRGDELGTRVKVDGGGPRSVGACGAAEGTVVEVRDLFFNVPARRKFLRSTAAESAQLTEVCEALALGAPTVSMRLSRDGKIVREWLPAPDLATRVRAALAGEELAEIHATRGPLEVHALLGRPERARAASTGLRVFVNGRVVKDRALSRTVAQAYGGVLEAGRYPLGAVFVELPPERVDVNVHPQKAEVRFSDGHGVLDGVFHVLSGELSRAFGLTPSAGRWAPAGGATPPFAGPSSAAPTLRRPVDAVAGPLPAPAPDAASPTYPATEPTTSRVSFEHEPARPRFSELVFLAQARGSYLVCEGREGLYVLDQHAAAERVTFHRLKQAFSARAVAMQPLLLPLVLDVPEEDAELVEERREELAAAGMDVRRVAPSKVALHGVPQLLVRASPERLVRDLLAEVSRAGRAKFHDAIDLALATMACHGSVRAGDRLSRDEAEALLRALDGVDFAGHCPHGRPVVTAMTFAELERRVGRR